MERAELSVIERPLAAKQCIVFLLCDLIASHNIKMNEEKETMLNVVEFTNYRKKMGHYKEQALTQCQKGNV